MLKTGVGISATKDPYSAGVEACQSAVLELGSEYKPGMLMVFSSVAFEQERVLQGVRSVESEALLVGSSTSGEITTSGPARDHSVVVMALYSDSAHFYSGIGNDVKAGARESGKTVADAVKAAAGGDELKLFMMFPDVLNGNGAEIVRGVLSSLGDHFPVVGGASGDDFKFEKVYQYLGNEVHTNSVVGVGISGDVTFGVGVKHGWIPLGLPKTVTKAVGSVLHEIDGKPAISIYEDYFGEERADSLRTQTLAKLAITYPLGIVSEASNELLIRDPITVDEKGSITCAAEVPEGAQIHLMIGSREEAVRVAAEAAQHALDELGGKKPAGVIIFNCIARNKLFGEHSGDEIDAIQNVVGRSTPLIGFYTYGEQAPIDGEVKNILKCNTAFHNETVVIVVLAE